MLEDRPHRVYGIAYNEARPGHIGIVDAGGGEGYTCGRTCTFQHAAAQGSPPDSVQPLRVAAGDRLARGSHYGHVMDSDALRLSDGGIDREGVLIQPVTRAHERDLRGDVRYRRKEYGEGEMPSCINCGKPAFVR